MQFRANAKAYKIWEKLNREMKTENLDMLVCFLQTKGGKIQSDQSEQKLGADTAMTWLQLAFARHTPQIEEEDFMPVVKILTFFNISIDYHWIIMLKYSFLHQ